MAMSVVTTKKGSLWYNGRILLPLLCKRSNSKRVRWTGKRSSNTPIVLYAVREMLEHWGDDEEPMYKIKQRLIIEDLKAVIPPNDHPDLWI